MVQLNTLPLVELGISKRNLSEPPSSISYVIYILAQLENLIQELYIFYYYLLYKALRELIGMSHQTN